LKPHNHSDKEFVLESLAAIARGAGRPPSRSEFHSLSGISEHVVSRFFPTWNDALRAAGLEPYTLNVRLEHKELLEDWAIVVRANRAIPSRRAYRLQGKYDCRTIERRLGPWSGLSQVFREFAGGKPQWADVLALLPDPAPKRLPHSTRSHDLAAHRKPVSSQLKLHQRRRRATYPPHLEILELSTLIQSLPTSED